MCYQYERMRDSIGTYTITLRICTFSIKYVLPTTASLPLMQFRCINDYNDILYNSINL